jgi:hypothetical protein
LLLPLLHLHCLQGFLTMAFLVETLLMGMHTKPNALDALVHKLLTGVMISCVAVCGAEIAKPDSLLLALLRPMMVFFQGTWFWHVGSIMFRGEVWGSVFGGGAKGGHAWPGSLLLVSPYNGCLSKHLVLHDGPIKYWEVVLGVAPFVTRRCWRCWACDGVPHHVLAVGSCRHVMV